MVLSTMQPKQPKFITEEEKLKIHLSRSYAERFRMLVRLIQIGNKLNKAKIIKTKA